MSVSKGSWSARYPNLMNILRGSLVGIDFSNLEDRAAMAMHYGKSIHVVTDSPTNRMADDALDAMLKAMLANLSGRKAD